MSGTSEQKKVFYVGDGVDMKEITLSWDESGVVEKRVQVLIPEEVQKLKELLGADSIRIDTAELTRRNNGLEEILINFCAIAVRLTPGYLTPGAVKQIKKIVSALTRVIHERQLAEIKNKEDRG